MRIIRKVIVTGILVLTGAMLGWGLLEWRQAGTPVSLSRTDAGPTLEQIQTLASLTTLKVNVADALVTELQGRTGGIRAVLVVHGSVTLGVDLAKARFESVDQRNRTAVLILPAPTIESVSLDPQKTRIVALVENGLWIIVPGRGEVDAIVTNLTYREAERVVSQAADDPDLMQRSRRQAEDVITTFFGAIGWTIRLRWIAPPRFARIAWTGVERRAFIRIHVFLF